MHKRQSPLSSVHACIAVLAVALLVPAAAQDDGSSRTRAIAVLPFHIEGEFGADEAESLNDQLGAQVFNEAAIDVIDPAKVRAALKGAGHDAVCASSCAYHVGNALGASYVFGATLSITEHTSSIAGTVYDVAQKRPVTLVRTLSGVGLHDLLELVEQTARDVAAAVAAPRSRAQAVTTQAVRSTPRAPVTRPANTRASLTITSVPSGAQVTLNGTPVGATPYHTDRLVAGAYDVTVSKPYHHTHTQRIVVAADAKDELALTLRPQFGGLTVTTAPSGASLVVNDKRLGTTPHTEKVLLPGRYAVRLDLDGYRPDSSLVTVREGKHDTLAVELLSLDSLTKAQSVKRGRRQWTRRLVFGGLGLGFAVAGLIANGQVNEHVADMEEAATKYSQDGLTTAEYAEYYDQYSSARGEAEDAAEARDWLYGIGGVFGVGFVISIWF